MRASPRPSAPTKRPWLEVSGAALRRRNHAERPLHHARVAGRGRLAEVRIDLLTRRVELRVVLMADQFTWLNTL